MTPASYFILVTIIGFMLGVPGTDTKPFQNRKLATRRSASGLSPRFVGKPSRSPPMEVKDIRLQLKLTRYDEEVATYNLQSHSDKEQHRQNVAISAFDSEGNHASLIAGLGSMGATNQNKLEPYMALCLAVKSEEVSELKYWIEYHAKLGVGKFYIYDESSVSLADQLSEYIASGLVEYVSLQERKGQLEVYAMCLSHPKAYQNSFIGFIDSDEFLVVRDPEISNLPSLLKKYGTKYGAIGVNWRLFGSSGQGQKPQGPVTENFWKCLPADDPQNRHIKSIVNTKLVKEVGPDPHTFIYHDGSFAVNTRGQKVTGAFSDSFVEDALVLFHYVVKSKEEFAAKMVRGSGMGNHRKWEFFHGINEAATDYCIDLVPESKLPSFVAQKRSHVLF